MDRSAAHSAIGAPQRSSPRRQTPARPLDVVPTRPLPPSSRGRHRQPDFDHHDEEEEDEEHLDVAGDDDEDREHGDEGPAVDFPPATPVHSTRASKRTRMSTAVAAAVAAPLPKLSSPKDRRLAERHASVDSAGHRDSDPGAGDDINNGLDDEDQGENEDEDEDDDTATATTIAKPVITAEHPQEDGPPPKKKRRVGRPPRPRSPGGTPIPDPRSLPTTAPGRPVGRPLSTPRGGGSMGPKSERPTPVPTAITFEDEEANEMDTDPVGESKVNEYGELLEGRKYRVSSFLLPERHPRRRYMFAPEVARHVGARDGFILFQKYPQLTRITTTIPEREMLIAQGHMAAHLKGRNIALITARTAFRHFGHKVVRGGRPIRDDYWVGDLEYVATGNTDDDESEFENQVLGAKPKERDHRDLLAAQTAVAIARSAEAAAIADREATAAAAELVHSSLLGVANRFAPVGVEDHGRNLSALALARSVADLDTFAAEHALARLSVTDISSPSTSSRVAEAVARARAEANVPSTAIAPESWMYQAALSAAAYNSKLNAFSRPRARVLEPLTGIWMVPANRNPEGPIKVQARIGGAAAPAHVPCTLDRDIGFPALEAVADAPVSQQHQWTSRMHVGRSSTSTTTTMVATLPNTPTSEDLMRQFPLAVAPGQAQAALALPRFIETPVAMVTTAVGPVPGVHTVSTGSAPASLSRRTVPASAVAPEGVTSVVLGTVGTDDDLRGLRGYNAGVSVGPAWAAAAAIATRSLSLLAPANYHQLTSSRRGGGAGSSHHSLSAIGAPGLDYKALGDKDPRGQHRCAGITPTADRCQRLVRLRGEFCPYHRRQQNLTAEERAAKLRRSRNLAAFADLADLDLIAINALSTRRDAEEEPLESDMEDGDGDEGASGMDVDGDGGTGAAGAATEPEEPVDPSICGECRLPFAADPTNPLHANGGNPAAESTGGPLSDRSTCAACTRVFHCECADIAAPPVRARAATYPWHCSSCKVCTVCDSAGEDSQLLLCDHCDRGWHSYCMQPRLDTLPDGREKWLCPSCQGCWGCGGWMGTANRGAAETDAGDAAAESGRSGRRTPSASAAARSRRSGTRRRRGDDSDDDDDADDTDNSDDDNDSSRMDDDNKRLASRHPAAGTLQPLVDEAGVYTGTYCAPCRVRLADREYCPVCLRAHGTDVASLAALMVSTVTCGTCSRGVHFGCDAAASSSTAASDSTTGDNTDGYTCPPCRVAAATASGATTTVTVPDGVIRGTLGGQPVWVSGAVRRGEYQYLSGKGVVKTDAYGAFTDMVAAPYSAALLIHHHHRGSTGADGTRSGSSNGRGPRGGARRGSGRGPGRPRGSRARGRARYAGASRRSNADSPGTNRASPNGGGRGSAASSRRPATSSTSMAAASGRGGRPRPNEDEIIDDDDDDLEGLSDPSDLLSSDERNSDDDEDDDGATSDHHHHGGRRSTTRSGGARGGVGSDDVSDVDDDDLASDIELEH